MLDPADHSAAGRADTHDVTCPFCGLLCDDLSIRNSDATLKVRKNGCPRAVAGFERRQPRTQPRVGGKRATLEEAVAAAARLLSRARQPLFGGLATDVDGARAVMALADRCGGVVDHVLGDAMMRNYLVLQDRGWMTTTLTEVKNRADLIILAGTDTVRDFPRFFERTVWNRNALFGPKPEAREIVYLGSKLQTKAGRSPNGRAPTHVRCDTRRLVEVLGALRALINKQPLQAKSVAGASVKELQALAERMPRASYGVIVWSAGTLAFEHAELTVQALCELVKDLNRTTRFAGLPLGGSEGATTAASVCAWQSGYPLRTSFASGAPVYDPLNNSTARLLSEGGADALLWTSSFTPEQGPPATTVPTVVLGVPGIKLAHEPAVYIPVGTPGVDHAGRLVRCDSVVTLPLRDLGRSSGLPSVADVTQSILNAV